jgi:TP901 family phage tail tape measure protein
VAGELGTLSARIGIDTSMLEVGAAKAVATLTNVAQATENLAQKAVPAMARTENALSTVGAVAVGIPKQAVPALTQTQNALAATGTAAVALGTKAEAGASRTKTAFSSIGGAVGTLQGQLAGLGLALGGALLAKQVYNWGSGIETNLTRAQLQMRSTAAESERMNKAIADAEVPVRAAESMRALGQAAKDTGEAIAALPTVEDFSHAFDLPRPLAVEILSRPLMAYGQGLEHIREYADKLVYAHTHARVSIEELGSAMVSAAPQAHALGYSMDYLFGLFMAAKAAGMSPADAVSGLMMAMRRSNEVAQKYNLTNRDIISVIQQLGGSSQEVQTILEGFGARSGGFLTVLLSKSELARQFSRDIKDAGGSLAAFEKVMASTPAERVEHLVGSLQKLADLGFKTFLPAFERLVDDLKDGFTWFSKLPEPIQKLTLGLTALALLTKPLIELAVALKGLGVASALAGAGGAAGMFGTVGGLGATGAVAGKMGPATYLESERAILALRYGSPALEGAGGAAAGVGITQLLRAAQVRIGMAIASGLEFAIMRVSPILIGAAIAGAIARLITGSGPLRGEEKEQAALRGAISERMGAPERARAAWVNPEPFGASQMTQALMPRPPATTWEQKWARVNAGQADIERLATVASAETAAAAKAAADAARTAALGMANATVGAYKQIIDAAGDASYKLTDMWDGWYTASVKLIDLKRAAFVEATGNEVLAAKVAESELEALAKEYAEKAFPPARPTIQWEPLTAKEQTQPGMFTMGESEFEAGQKEHAAKLEADQKSYEQWANNVSTRMAQGFEAGFFSVVKGKFDDLRNYMDRIAQEIIGTLMKRVTDQIVASVFPAPKMAGAPAGGGGFDFMGTAINIASTVPFLAEGGRVDSPTLAMIGESGPEVVIPLDKIRPTRRDNRGGPSTVVHMNVTTNDAQSFKESESQIAGRLALRLRQSERMR